MGAAVIRAAAVYLAFRAGRRPSPIAALAAALVVAGCAAPPFPEQAAYPFGLAEAVASAERASAQAATPQERLAQTRALQALRASQCPDWRAARLRHPLDAVYGNPFPQDAIAMGCANMAALDAMVARRDDLTAPPAAVAPASAAAVARSVKTYRTTGPAPLPNRETGS
jgi:hypothetical protein